MYTRTHTHVHTHTHTHTYTYTTHTHVRVHTHTTHVHAKKEIWKNKMVLPGTLVSISPVQSNPDPVQSSPVVQWLYTTIRQLRPSYTMLACNSCNKVVTKVLHTCFKVLHTCFCFVTASLQLLHATKLHSSWWQVRYDKRALWSACKSHKFIFMLVVQYYTWLCVHKCFIICKALCF